MISTIKRVLSEYPTITMKITLDTPTIAFVQSNLCLLTNVKMLLGLNAIMPLLEAIHFLIKFAQLCDMFVCDFITTVKICEKVVYHMYYDSQCCFQCDVY
jgi:hypothetical protein